MFAAVALPRNVSSFFPSVSFFGCLDIMKPSIGASSESCPHFELIDG